MAGVVDVPNGVTGAEDCVLFEEVECVPFCYGDLGGKDGGLQAAVKLRDQVLYLVEGLGTVLGSL